MKDMIVRLCTSVSEWLVIHWATWSVYGYYPLDKWASIWLEAKYRNS